MRHMRVLLVLSVCVLGLVGCGPRYEDAGEAVTAAFEQLEPGAVTADWGTASVVQDGYRLYLTGGGGIWKLANDEIEVPYKVKVTDVKVSSSSEIQVATRDELWEMIQELQVEEEDFTPEDLKETSRSVVVYWHPEGAAASEEERWVFWAFKAGETWYIVH